MPAELLKSTPDQEKAPHSKVEVLQSGQLYTLEDNTPALEVRGSLSRLASFELGTGKAGEEGPLNPDDPRVAIVDIWKNGQGDFLVSPRSLETVEEINEKAWKIADLPKQQLPLGRSRNELWEGVTGSPLPEQVSGQHFGIALGEDGKLNFVDVGSTNGTRMETAIAPEPGIAEALSAEKRAFEQMTGLLEEAPESEKEPATPPASVASAEEPPVEIESAIHERLLTEPLDLTSVPEPEKSPANKEVDQTLRAMKGGVDGWLLTLREKPTFTRSDHLYGVSAEVTKQMAWLDEITQKESDPELKGALESLGSDMQNIKNSAMEVASNVDANAYRSGAEAHEARRQIERQLEAYGNSLIDIYRKISERLQTTR